MSYDKIVQKQLSHFSVWLIIFDSSGSITFYFTF